jgi:hypothetical protein
MNSIKVSHEKKRDPAKAGKKERQNGKIAGAHVQRWGRRNLAVFVAPKLKLDTCVRLVFVLLLPTAMLLACIVAGCSRFPFLG